MTEPNYEGAWRALSEPLSWMHDNQALKAYWGWNLASIANDLIDRAYPGLRNGTASLATAEAASGAGEREEWPAKWAGPLTVGNMIANLRTLPADMPIHSAYHLIREGKPSRLFVKHPTVSRERVDGREIKTGDESVPYSAVIWSHDRNPDAASLPPATDPAIEDCARIASLELAAALANIEVGYRPAHNNGAREAAERIERRIRALAAAPTIPATREVIDQMRADAREFVEAADAEGFDPNDALDLIRTFATGHAATEGEGA